MVLCEQWQIGVCAARVQTMLIVRTVGQRWLALKGSEVWHNRNADKSDLLCINPSHCQRECTSRTARDDFANEAISVKTAWETPKSTGTNTNKDTNRSGRSQKIRKKYWVCLELQYHRFVAICHQVSWSMKKEELERLQR